MILSALCGLNRAVDLLRGAEGGDHPAEQRGQPLLVPLAGDGLVQLLQRGHDPVGVDVLLLLDKFGGAGYLLNEMNIIR